MESLINIYRFVCRWTTYPHFKKSAPQSNTHLLWTVALAQDDAKTTRRTVTQAYSKCRYAMTEYRGVLAIMMTLIMTPELSTLGEHNSYGVFEEIIL